MRRLLLSWLLAASLATGALAPLAPVPPVAAQEITSTGPLNLGRYGRSTVSINPGVVTVAGKVVTVGVTGVKAGDTVVVSPSAAQLSLGVGIGAARAPVDGSVEISLITTLVAGITLSSMTVQVSYFGP